MGRYSKYPRVPYRRGRQPSPRDGKFIEEIGTYQPLKPGDNFTFKLDRAKYWLSQGAQPTIPLPIL